MLTQLDPAAVLAGHQIRTFDFVNDMRSWRLPISTYAGTAWASHCSLFILHIAALGIGVLQARKHAGLRRTARNGGSVHILLLQYPV